MTWGQRARSSATIVAALTVIFGAVPVAAALPPGPADVATPGPGARKTSTGIAFKILRPGHGREHPQPNDCVKVHFTGWQRDGKVVADSRREDLPEVQCLRQVSHGVAEALRAML